MTTIRIGELPAPLLPFFQQYLTNRGNQKTMNYRSRWLFPGTPAGHHITAQTLMHQFRAAGIDIQAIRNAALHDLVKEIDAASLADLLGYTSQTINIHAARGGPNGHLTLATIGHTYAPWVSIASIHSTPSASCRPCRSLTGDGAKYRTNTADAGTATTQNHRSHPTQVSPTCLPYNRVGDPHSHRDASSRDVHLFGQ
ncbi:hypothetical protein [Antrihabitans stalactiti]|uniref:Uncharacterized protein n=1 Tax=Antrihabitans stalactiti TaxID=2584121 RepID=A0A848KJ70_9NOCA|nr:hypothetical protein [Antrihabitans stalactiti]NMN96722.1 hypothetical protein [Antrihabitans stalactiti]